jgi:hypothetical protein
LNGSSLALCANATWCMTTSSSPARLSALWK